jgi:hypothetical protein
MKNLPMRTLPLFFGCCALLAALTPARAEKNVAVFSTAIPEYVSKRGMKDGKPIPQSYLFMQGKFLPGFTKDPGLERTSFQQIAAKLAGDLAQQQYYPAKTLKSADLLLVVHWGATSPRRHDNTYVDTAATQMAASRYFIPKQGDEGVPENSAGDPATEMLDDRQRDYAEAMDAQLFAMESNAIKDQASLLNTAATLGLSRELNRENKRYYSEKRATLNSMLEEERYFIVVVAYDAKELFSSKKLRRLWIARLSIRSPGVNFPTGLERMSRVGGNYFGTELDEIKLQQAPLREGKVEIGEFIVITDQK